MHAARPVPARPRSEAVGASDRRRAAARSCLAACLAVAACAPLPRIPTSGDLLGHRIETTADSAAARYYVEGYLSGRNDDARLTAQIEALHRRHERSLPTREDLRALSEAFSVDFASLFLAHRLLLDACNRALDRSFAAALDDRSAPDPGLVAAYTVLFVPGWDYRDNGHLTGADFARPRAIATRIGLDNHLVALPPTGSVEDNAAVLASEIARHGASGRKIVLAGASSAGPAIHLALGELLGEEARRPVRAWLNLGGLLQGTPLVDLVESRPWLLAPIVWFTGWDREAILSMGTARSRQRFARLRLDGRIVVVNYLGIPLSGQITRNAADKYPILAAHGPNDGLTLLTDAIAPGGPTIVALGSDHFFAEDPRIDEKALALMKLVLALAERGTTADAGPCVPGYPAQG